MKPTTTYSAFFLLVLAAIFLAACSASPGGPLAAAQSIEDPNPTGQGAPADLQPLVTNRGGTIIWADGQPVLDEQGAVSVEIKPLNLNDPGETLDFEVALNTHSVDLSMDLAALSTLTTDTGKTIAATRWVAPVGGHHVSGILSFPASQEGAPVLDKALRLTLTIVDLNVPQRTFQWIR